MRSLLVALMLFCLCLADMDIFYLKEAAATKGAVCLDGTPGAYFFKAGSAANSTKWVFHLLGGGICFTDLECLIRSQSYMGSTMYWPSTFKYGGPLSENATYNPDFYDWNHAFFVYCDGSSFGSDTDKPVSVAGKTIYYRGHRILLATIEDLLKSKGLDKATDVLVVGDSAGGIATFMHIDEIKSMMPKSVTRFKAAPFSGVFLDYPNAEGKQVMTPNFKLAFETHNCTRGVNQRCIAAMSPENRFKCIMAEYNIQFIESPLFLIGSAYDTVGTACIVGGEPMTGPSPGVGNCSAVPGWALCEKDSTKCTKEQWEKIEGYADAFFKRIENSPKVNSDGNGIFEYNCHTHAVEPSRAWELYSVKGKVMRDAVRDWFFSDNEPASKHFYKDCVNHGSYSCNPTCSIPVRDSKL